MTTTNVADQYIQTTYATANHDDYASTYNQPQVYYNSHHYDSYGNLHETNYVVEDPCYRDDHGLCYLFENDKRFQVQQQANSRIADQSSEIWLSETQANNAALLLSPNFLHKLRLKPGEFAAYAKAEEDTMFENVGGLEGYVQYYESINTDDVD